jgi:protein CpxP
MKGKKMKNIRFLTISVLLVIVMSSFGFSQMRNRDERPDMGDMMKKKLQLTDEQAQKIEQLRFNFQEKMIDLNSQLKKKELEREKILSDENLNRSDLVSITKEIQNAKNNIAIEKVNHQMDVYDILNANQKQIWKKIQLKMDGMKYRMKNEFKDRMMERFDGGMRSRMNQEMQNQPPDQNEKN